MYQLQLTSLNASYRKRRELLPEAYESGRERGVSTVRQFDSRITAVEPGAASPRGLVNGLRVISGQRIDPELPGEQAPDSAWPPSPGRVKSRLAMRRITRILRFFGSPGSLSIGMFVAFP